MPISKAAALPRMINQKCQSITGFHPTNGKEALITCPPFFKLEGEAGPPFNDHIYREPTIPHYLREEERSYWGK